MWETSCPSFPNRNNEDNGNDTSATMCNRCLQTYYNFAKVVLKRKSTEDLWFNCLLQTDLIANKTAREAAK